MNNSTQDALPYSVVQILREWKKPFRDEVRAALKEQLAITGRRENEITQADIDASVAAAYDQLVREAEDQRHIARPDPLVAAQALREYEAGEWKPAQEIADELRSSSSEHC